MKTLLMDLIMKLFYKFAGRTKVSVGEEGIRKQNLHRLQPIGNI